MTRSWPRRLAAVLTLCATFGGTWNAGAAEPLKIGVISERSGPFALNGTQGEMGDTLAAEEINAKGGILGHPIELITTDSKSRAEDASRLFRELAAGGATIIIGNIAGGESLAGLALSKELKVPFFTVGSYARPLTEEKGHRYFFRLITNARGFYGPMAERLAQLPYKRWCTISIDLLFGRDTTEQVMSYLKQRKPDTEVIPGCQYWVPLSTTDFSSYITAIMAQRPDALMFGGLVGPAGIAFVRQGNAFGLFKLIPGAHPALGWPSNNQGLTKQDIPPNVITAGDYLYPPVDRPENLAFMAAFRKRFNTLALSEAANSYTTLKFIAAAFDKAGSLDREAFINAAEGMTIDHPAQGPITLRPFDHQATTGLWVGMLTWDAKDNRPGLADPVFVSSTKYLPTAAEVAAQRAAFDK
jgi:branched-chain amino acid transport system substrate-binding protein